jgi:hypothetical protein
MRTPVAAAAAVVAKQIIDRVEEKISSDSFWGGGFASGTDYVARDMVTKIHKGERITPAAFNPTRGERGGGDAELIAAIRSLQAKLVEALGSNGEDIRGVVKSSVKTLNLLDRLTQGGKQIPTKEVTV